MRGIHLAGVHGECGPEQAGGFAVRDDEREREHHSGRRERRARRRRDDAEREARERQELEEELLLSPEERALRRAHRAAEEKTRLAAELAPPGVAALVLAALGMWPVALIVLLVWGRRPLRRAWRVFVEPKLRERFVEQEVRREVAATLSHERQALETEHARSMQRLSASIAHEIRNPITAAKSLVQQMEEDPTSRENVEYARVALEELERVERSVSHLLRFARDEEMSIAEIRLADVVDSALDTFRDRIERKGVTLARRHDGPGEMEGDPEQLRRVAINLVANALDSLEAAGVAKPRLDVSTGESLAGTEVWLRVRDNGPGIEPEVRERLFSPFHSSKPGGNGLGLAICRKLVDAHGGSIEVESAPGAGAEFVVVLPRRRRPREATP
jgi:signal transduction histidine kinase